MQIEIPPVCYTTGVTLPLKKILPTVGALAFSTVLLVALLLQERFHAQHAQANEIQCIDDALRAEESTESPYKVRFVSCTGFLE